MLDTPNKDITMVDSEIQYIITRPFLPDVCDDHR